MLVTTLIVDGGIVVLMLVLLTVVCAVVSAVADVVVIGFVEAGLDAVAIVVGDASNVVVADGFGTNESTTPIGPSRSTSDSEHDNSSG